MDKTKLSSVGGLRTDDRGGGDGRDTIASGDRDAEDQCSAKTRHTEDYCCAEDHWVEDRNAAKDHHAEDLRSSLHVPDDDPRPQYLAAKDSGCNPNVPSRCTGEPTRSVRRSGGPMTSNGILEATDFSNVSRFIDDLFVENVDP